MPKLWFRFVGAKTRAIWAVIFLHEWEELRLHFDSKAHRSNLWFLAGERCDLRQFDR